MTGRADILPQKFFHTLHTLFVLHLGKGIFDCIHRIKIREVHLPGRTAGLILVDHMLFDRRAMKDNVPLLRCQLLKRHIRAHAQISCNILHQRPHQRLPRPHRALVDRQRFIRHQTVQIYSPHQSRTTTFRAGTLTVKSQLLRTRWQYSFAAHRTVDQLFCCHSQRRINIMPVRTSVTGQPGIHQPQTV